MRASACILQILGSENKPRYFYAHTDTVCIADVWGHCIFNI